MENPNLPLRRSIEQAIHPNWLLAHERHTRLQDGGERIVWHLTEPDAEHCLLKIHAHAAVAFSLDQRGKSPFPFLGTGLAGMHTVADCIVVTEYQGIDYIVIIEMKTTPNPRSKKKAVQQILASGRLMEWLCKTLQALEHWHGMPMVVGVISYLPRETPRKGTFARALPQPENQGGIAVFELTHHPVLDLPGMLAVLGEKPGETPED